jgi:hypothetical protein
VKPACLFLQQNFFALLHTLRAFLSLCEISATDEQVKYGTLLAAVYSIVLFSEASLNDQKYLFHMTATVAAFC